MLMDQIELVGLESIQDRVGLQLVQFGEHIGVQLVGEHADRKKWQPVHQGDAVLVEPDMRSLCARRCRRGGFSARSDPAACENRENAKQYSTS